MGHMEMDGEIYGDGPYRSIGVGGGETNVFDAHAMRTAKPASAKEALAYAERRLKQRLAVNAAKRFRDGDHMEYARTLDKVLPGLSYRPKRFVIAVLHHRREFGPAPFDVTLNAALIYARYERRRERVSSYGIAAE